MEARGRTELLGNVVALQREIAACGSDRSRALCAIAEHTRALIGASCAFVELLEADGLFCRAHAGQGPARGAERRELTECLGGHCVLQDRSQYAPDTASDPRVDGARCMRVGIRSLAASPLHQHGQVMGVLNVGSAQVAGFDAEQRAQLDLLASLCEAALASCDAQADSETNVFFEQSLDLLAIVGPDDRIERMNDAWSATLGWTREELMSSSLLEYVHPDDRARTFQQAERVRTGISAQRFRNRLRTKQGDYRWLEWKALHRASGRSFCIARDVTAQMQLEDELLLCMRALESTASGVVITDASAASHPIVYVNPAYEQMTGYTLAELSGKSYLHLVGGDCAQVGFSALRDALREQEARHAMLRCRRKSGESFVASLMLSPVSRADGRASHFITIVEDITQRVEDERRKHEQAAIMEAVIESMSDCLTVCDPEGRIVLMNETAKRLFGSQLDDPTHPPWPPGCGVFASDRVTRYEREDSPSARALRGETVEQEELWLRLPGWTDGRWHSVTSSVVSGPGGVVLGAVTVARDITERKTLEERIRLSAMTDELTGLYNRRGFVLMAEQQLRVAARRGQPLSLLFIDLNDLKRVNDELGHELGDEALTETAILLRRASRGSDLVARLGGDEFVVLLDGDGSAAERLRARVERCCVERNRTLERFQLSLSIGCAVYDPKRPVSLTQLIADADRAMYEVKRRIKSTPSPSEVA